MPRRPAEVMEDVPLFLIPHVIMQKIRTSGEDLEGVAVKRTQRHFYTVSVRNPADPARVPVGAGGQETRK